MHEDENLSLASLAMRLRALTDRPPVQCKQFLEALPQEVRVEYVQHMEQTRAFMLVEPIELDPLTRERLGQLRLEADELRRRGDFGHGMGAGGRYQFWVKTELKRRYGIDWHTTREFNRDIAFD
ncbi:hypothetical protein [Ideonella sp.]|uniref:hypothetical protein n=1 Tax=Ideonella sp. TaxID=1929293 RepID=UPI003BB54A7C